MKYLFICGTPRSGTTLLARVLGSNDKVVMGVERYKNLLASPSFGPALFDKERFFDFRAEDSNVGYRNHEALYDAARTKYDSAAFVGDKVPNLYKSMRRIDGLFAGKATFVFCYRNVYDVAASWNVRARNPNDKWPEENDYSKAADAWMSSFRHALVARKHKVDVVPFNYDAFAGAGKVRGTAYYGEFLARLGLGAGASDSAVLEAEFARLPAIRRKQEALTDEMRSQVDAHIDTALLMQFIKVFRVGPVGMPESIRESWVRYLKLKSAS